MVHKYIYIYISYSSTCDMSIYGQGVQPRPAARPVSATAVSYESSLERFRHFKASDLKSSTGSLEPNSLGESM